MASCTSRWWRVSLPQDLPLSLPACPRGEKLLWLRKLNPSPFHLKDLASFWGPALSLDRSDQEANQSSHNSNPGARQHGTARGARGGRGDSLPMDRNTHRKGRLAKGGAPDIFVSWFGSEASSKLQILCLR